MGVKPRTTEERFWEQVEKTDTCWIWLGAHVPQKYGGPYGKFGSGSSTVLAHRWSYINACGQIPDGLELDHLCRNRLCVRPDHLEAVTTRVNTRRAAALKTHCPQGHVYDEANTYIHKVRQDRQCRQCRREKQRRKK